MKMLLYVSKILSLSIGLIIFPQLSAFEQRSFDFEHAFDDKKRFNHLFSALYFIGNELVSVNP